MVHYAEIDPASNIVLRVIVCDSKEWCERNLGGTWVRTYYSTPGKNYAGQGYIYYPDHENFSAPQPYPSWTLNTTTFLWEPPVPYPQFDTESDRIVSYDWDESTRTWVERAL